MHTSSHKECVGTPPSPPPAHLVFVRVGQVGKQRQARLHHPRGILAGVQGHQDHWHTAQQVGVVVLVCREVLSARGTRTG
jgi:hypothetical protein